MPPRLAQMENRVTPCMILFSREGGRQFMKGTQALTQGSGPYANRMGKHAYQAHDGKNIQVKTYMLGVNRQ